MSLKLAQPSRVRRNVASIVGEKRAAPATAFHRSRDVVRTSIAGAAASPARSPRLGCLLLLFLFLTLSFSALSHGGTAQQYAHRKVRKGVLIGQLKHVPYFCHRSAFRVLTASRLPRTTMPGRGAEWLSIDNGMASIWVLWTTGSPRTGYLPTAYTMHRKFHCKASSTAAR